MLGSFGLAAGLAGWLYEEALKRHGGGGELCIGQDCYQTTFFTLAGLGLVATAAAVQLYRRKAHLYAAEAVQLHAYDDEVQRQRGNSRAPSRQH